MDDAVGRGLAGVGGAVGDAAVDAVVDGARAAVLLEGLVAGGRVLLRVWPPVGEGSAAYAPAPVEPLWARVEGASATVRVGAVRPDDAVAASGRQVERVLLDVEELPCCGAASCSLVKARASAWMVLEGEPGRLLVAEALDPSAGGAVARVGRVGAALAKALGVPFEVPAGVALRDDGGAVEESEEEGAALSIEELARFGMRSEGVGAVLRDHASRGPRGRARRLLVIAALLGLVAVALWAVVGRGVRSGAGTGFLLGVGVVAALVSLTAYAFLGVGRFAARYAARSSPLLWVGEGRLTAMPWVARDGRVDLRAEGRFGASIPLAEVRGAAVRRREEGWAVELATDHGTIDALLAGSEGLADHWCSVLLRVIGDAAHPEAKASARQRARQRGEAEVAKKKKKKKG